MNKQIVESDQWALIRVRNLRHGGLGTADPYTLVDFDYLDLDLSGHSSGIGTLWHWGADTDGGTLTGTSPRFTTGSFYVVLLKHGKHGLELLHDGASVLSIESLTAGLVSPWDSVHFSPGLDYVPPGQTRPVSDVQLHELVDGLATFAASTAAPAPTPAPIEPAGVRDGGMP